MRFTAAIFDLDGVLADTASLHFKAWKRMTDAIDTPFDETMNEQLKGVSRMASLDIILERAPKPYSAEQREDLARSKNDYYVEMIATVTPRDLLPGASQTLEAFKASGVGTALASASRNAPAIVERLGIMPLLDYIADANDVVHQKPDPEIFLRAATGLQAAPHACVAFEDAIAGVKAIKSADMLAIGIGERSILTQADHVYASLADFPIDDFLG